MTVQFREWLEAKEAEFIEGYLECQPGQEEEFLNAIEHIQEQLAGSPVVYSMAGPEDLPF